MSSRFVRLAIIQMTTTTLEKDKNLEKSIKLLQRAVREKAQIAVLPELCISGNAFSNIDEAKTVSETIPDGLTTSTWVDFAGEHDIYIVGGVCEKSNDSLFNSAVFITPNGFRDKYRKIHLWHDEKNFFVPGNEFKVYDTPIAKIGIMICYDGFFPESTRILMEMGAELICQPTAEKQIFDMEINKTRSYENAVFIGTANLVGKERKSMYAGHSQITNPTGEIIALAGENKEEVVICDIDITESKTKKQITELNNVQTDRRNDLYSRLLGYGDE